MHRLAQPAVLILLGVFLAFSQTDPQTPSTSGGTQAQGSQIQYIRSVSGSKGAPENGKFVMEDPRTVFYIPTDRQVIVYVEWEGPIGKHHMEGFWKNPDGKVSALVDFDYEATQRRFGAYWTFTLSDSAQLGKWTLEAHVDGEFAGAHNFEILSGTPNADAAPARRELRAAELYDRALNASVMIEKLDSNGERGSQASGFMLDPGWVVTAFEAIDGATKVRITLPDGRKIETNQVLAWDRWKDLAVLKIDLGGKKPLRRVDQDSWTVGDEVSFLSMAPDGNRVISSASINGKSDQPKIGQRISFNFNPPSGSIGSALLNSYGEVIAIVVGSPVPGASVLQIAKRRPQVPLDEASRITGGSALPITTLASTLDETKVTSFDQLLTNGQFIPPIQEDPDVSYGSLARQLEKDGKASFPKGTGSTFSKHDSHVVAYVMWDGHKKRKGLVTLRIYNLDGDLINKSWANNPTKLTLNPGENSMSSWDFDIAPLEPTFYRAEAWIDNTPVWRSFFRITE